MFAYQLKHRERGVRTEAVQQPRQHHHAAVYRDVGVLPEQPDIAMGHRHRQRAHRMRAGEVHRRLVHHPPALGGDVYGLPLLIGQIDQVAVVAAGGADVDFDLVTVVDTCGGERGQCRLHRGLRHAHFLGTPVRGPQPFLEA